VNTNQQRTDKDAELKSIELRSHVSLDKKSGCIKYFLSSLVLRTEVDNKINQYNSKNVEVNEENVKNAQRMLKQTCTNIQSMKSKSSEHAK